MCSRPLGRTAEAYLTRGKRFTFPQWNFRWRRRRARGAWPLSALEYFRGKVCPGLDPGMDTGVPQKIGSKIESSELSATIGVLTTGRGATVAD